MNKNHQITTTTAVAVTPQSTGGPLYVVARKLMVLLGIWLACLMMCVFLHSFIHSS